MAKFGVILAAAGQSRRFGNRGYKKPFIPLDGKAVWLHSAELFLKCRDVQQVVLVIDPHDREAVATKFGPNLAFWGIDLVEGGAERADSVERGLRALDSACDFVAVHDAARPCLSRDVIDRTFQAAVQHGAATAGIPVSSTVKRVGDDGFIEATVSRERLWLAQTPQVVRRDLLVTAFSQRGTFQPTDEAQLLERAGIAPKMVLGSPLNIKITVPEDLALAKQMLKSLPKTGGLDRLTGGGGTGDLF